MYLEHPAKVKQCPREGKVAADMHQLFGSYNQAFRVACSCSLRSYR